MAKSNVLYLEAQKRDFIQKFLLFQNGYWLRNEDGKIDWNRRMHPEPPWIYTKSTLLSNCHLWHKIMFDILFKKRWIPSGCLNCWKVVLAPKNLRELVTMYLMQRELMIPSKCGTEFERDNTSKLYGAYFYNFSFEEGKRCFDMLQNEFAKKKTYSGNILEVPFEGRFEDDVSERLILKRGCTEYEQEHGKIDPLDWDATITEEQLEIEALAINCFVSDVPNLTPSEMQLAHIFNNWIHGAYRLGDETYKDFTDGQELFLSCRTYHDKPIDFMKNRFTQIREEPKDGQEIK